MKQSKANIYNQYGIKYANGKIYHGVLGWIKPLLINGNAKLGKGVWTFSTLPTNKMYIESFGPFTDKHIKGTCPCHCDGCYATKGFYNMPTVITSLAMKTWIARHDVDFMTRAIMAQIAADRITICRIHASGDFFDAAHDELVSVCRVTGVPYGAAIAAARARMKWYARTEQRHYPDPEKLLRALS